jgi:hypothetical protein
MAGRHGTNMTQRVALRTRCAFLKVSVIVMDSGHKGAVHLSYLKRVCFTDSVQTITVVCQ